MKGAESEYSQTLYEAMLLFFIVLIIRSTVRWHKLMTSIYF